MAIKSVQMIIRIFGLIQIVLGGIIWPGNADFLIVFHIISGSILTLALFWLIYRAFRAGVARGLVILAAVWTLLLPIFGLVQDKILPESSFWIAQLIHVLSGVGIVGLAEMIGPKISKQRN